MRNILKNIIKSIRTNKKVIVFPEAEDIRVLKACKILQKENICNYILLGNAMLIKKRLSENNLSLQSLPIIDIKKSDKENFE